MKSSKPLSISICDCLKRFDSGLRHYQKVEETLILQRFLYFFLNCLNTLGYCLTVSHQVAEGSKIVPVKSS